MKQGSIAASRIGALAAMLYALVLVGCSPSRQEARSDATNANKPSSLMSAKPRDVGSACFLETVNGASVRSKPVLRAGGTAAFIGWATVADRANPVPPLVYVVLRPRSSQGNKDIYLTGGRMPRPEMAGENDQMQMAGFEALQPLPEAEGPYEILIVQADAGWMTTCSTGMEVHVKGASG